jgi:hypothetical protein
MKIRTTDWDAVLASAPNDATAATVTAKSTDAPLSVKLPDHIQHWESPPEMRPIPPLHKVQMGHKKGRFTVVGYWKAVKDKKLYVCRCACGRYEPRREKSLLRTGHDECRECLKLHWVQDHAKWLLTAEGKQWSLTKAKPLIEGD